MRTVAKFVAVIFAVMLVGVAIPSESSVNPFVDVELNHWAYDAVRQLNARGIVAGYEDGMFKGNKAASRYEVASVVARMLAFVDVNKASKQDVEILKQLAFEFHEELKLLGVKNEQLDSRLQVLEENVGGWKLAGKFVFLADFTNTDNSPYDVSKNSSFKFDTAEIHLSKIIDDKTSFHSILATDKNNNTDLGNLYWKNFYISVALPFDVDAKIGRFTIDWSRFVADKDPWFLNNEKDGFLFTKRFNANVHVAAYVSNQAFTDEHMTDLMDANSDVMTYGLKAGFDTERFGGDVQYHVWDFKNTNVLGTDDNISAIAVTGYFNVYRSAKVFGEYWKQNLDTSWQLDNIDNPDAFRVGFYIGQDMLKYTDLHVEYNQWNRGFILQNDPYRMYDTDVVFAVRRSNLAFDHDTSAWFTKLEQKWSDKWTTFGRYVLVEQDNAFKQKVTNWSIGVRHWYTPALSFELSYDSLKFDNVGKEDDSLIRFKTSVSF